MKAATGRKEAWAALVGAVILAFYLWTARSNFPGGQPLFGSGQGDYLNLSLHGMLHGHLYLDAAPDPRLLALPDPYEPSARAGLEVLHDASLYRGHYYIYFGVTPIVTLLLPWRLLTGHDLPQLYAVLLFTAAGFVAAALLWRALCRRYFPGASGAVLAAGVAMLGLGSMTLALLRRPGLWEEPVAAGYCFAMLALAAVERGLRAAKPAPWMAGAGLCLGFAVGARPDYAAGSALLVPLALWALRPFSPRRLASILAGAGAFGFVIAALLAYNYARFGNPFEFGEHYQLNGGEYHHQAAFGLRYFWANGYLYYLAPAHWVRYFPFAGIPRPPADSPAIVEYVYGLGPNFPFVWMALAVPLAWRHRPEEEGRALRTWTLAAAAFYAAVTFGLLCFLPGVAARYMVDFTPTLSLLAAVGLAGLERAWRGRPRSVAVAIGTLAAAFSAAVGVLASFQLHGLLRAMNPSAYGRIARTLDWPVYAFERLAGIRHGPVEMIVRFPAGAPGALEPLVATGWANESDCLFVRYLDAQHLQLGFAHANRPVIWSPILQCDARISHRLTVAMGSILPPPEYPWYALMDEFAAEGFSRWLRVTLDGQVAFDQAQDFYDGSPRDIRFGSNPDSPATYGTVFTGQILQVRTLPISIPARSEAGYGAREFEVAFPAEWPAPLPLVTTGRTGRGDALYVHPGRPGCVRFGYDHWGIGSWESPDIPITPLVAHRLRIRMPSLLGAISGAVEIQLDGRTVWREAVPAYPARPAELHFGANPIGASTCGPAFTGVIRAVRLIRVQKET